MNANKLTPRNLIAFLLITTFYAALPLLIVGRFDWTRGWIYAVLILFSTLGSRALAARKNPGILAERANSLSAENIKDWDKKMMPLVGILGPLTVLLVSGLDVRFGWSPVQLGWIAPAALVMLTLGLLFSTWAFVENKFFSGTVRIQTERGHRVIDTGPYQYVRHPGYASAILIYLATPVYLDSLWGLIPALLTAILFTLRAALEDKTLQEELPGYYDYAKRTKYRLFPGVW
jgi:protein-S-isoprenylcysteine O-methyltransferase Ste14